MILVLHNMAPRLLSRILASIDIVRKVSPILLRFVACYTLLRSKNFDGRGVLL